MKASIAIFLACLIGLSFAHEFGNAAQAMLANATLGLIAVVLFWAITLLFWVESVLRRAITKWRENRT